MLQLYWKRNSSAGILLWILQNFTEYFFSRTPPGDCIYIVSLLKMFWKYYRRSDYLHWKFFADFNKNTQDEVQIYEFHYRYFSTNFGTVFIVILFIEHLPLINYNKFFYMSRTKVIKDTHREKAPSNKTQAYTKGMNMDIWVVGTSKQLFIRVS